ncbi:hypothetical protein ACBY01_07160 [Sphingomonas sp. ac-8]|uniref:hypothetical protein n=1 Tax=Sphingomonas sp. ac-8 TaxID=3242977 RepID=UPI003A80DB5F
MIPALPTTAAGTRLLLDSNPIVGEPKAGGRRFWTTREIALVREHYPVGGVQACLPLIHGRSASSIYQRAGILGLHAPGGTPFEQREHLASSPAIDEAIRRWHAAGARRDGLVELVRATMRPRRWVTNRAKRLGLTPPRFRSPAWTTAEDDILRSFAGKMPSTAVAALKRAGYRRTETAVVVRSKRLHISRVPEDSFSATELAQLFGVDGKAVTSWIEKGWLKATRASDAAGSPYRIKPAAIRTFIMDNVSLLKLGRVDPHWFVDLLGHRA